MKYRITLANHATYELDSSLYTPEQARQLAEEWFAERTPEIDFKILAPCEVDGIWPHDDCNCSLCR